MGIGIFIFIMGFLGNMMEEFGTKTGKALGNKLYGRNADDYRIGFGVQEDNHSKSKRFDDDDDIENELMTKQIERDNERDDQLLNELLSVEFDYNNKDAIIRTISKIASLVDLWLMNGDSDKKLAAAKSKFDTGLAMLTAIDPSNPMIPYFNNKKVEWTSRQNEESVKAKKEGRTNTIILICCILGPIVAMAILYAVTN